MCETSNSVIKLLSLFQHLIITILRFDDSYKITQSLSLSRDWLIDWFIYPRSIERCWDTYIFNYPPPSHEKGKFLPRRLGAKNYLGCVVTYVLPIDKPPTHIIGYMHHTATVWLVICLEETQISLEETSNPRLIKHLSCISKGFS